MIARAWGYLWILSVAGGLALGYALHAPPAPAPSVRAADHAAALHAPGLRAIDTIVVHDTVRSNHWFARWDTARVTDTIVRDSVVYVRRDEADSTIRSCRITAIDCMRRGDSLATMLAAARVQIAARDAERPSRVHHVVEDAVAFAVGWGSCKAGLRVPLPNVKVPP